MRKTLLLAALSALLFSVSCSTERVSPSLPEFPPVFLITVDTLRADHLSCYGYRPIQTRFMDQLASDGILFEQAIAPAPITLPSHASILTGTHPVYHGVRDNTGFILPEGLPTLPEILSSSGYRTGAFVGAYVLHSSFGLDRGFDRYSENFGADPSATSMEISERPARAVIEAAQSWIGSQTSNRLFVWMHLFDPHAPYSPPTSFPGNEPYDQEILYVDGALGGFFEFLEKNGLFEQALIILTSDHGEGLGEHGEDTHGMFLYDTTLRVPLLVKLPAGAAAGTRVGQQVRLVDLVPTILDLLDLPVPTSVQGRSIRPGWEDGGLEEQPAFSEALLPLLNYGWSDLSSLRTGGFKLIEGPTPELFDLTNDPRETNNLSGSAPQLLLSMNRQLDLLLPELADPVAARALRSPDPETLHRLRSLGYVGSSGLDASAGSEDPVAELRKKLGGNLADPKSKIHLFNQVWQAQELVQGGRHQEAIDILDRILSEDSTIFLAHSLRALALLALNHYQAALRALDTAVRLRPEDPGAHIYRGIAAIHLDRLDEAAGSLERGLALDPTNRAARNNLATVYLRQNKIGEATRIFETLAAEDPGDLAVRLNLGTLYLQTDRILDAQKMFQEVIDTNPSIPEAHNNLALTYKAQGKLDEAEEHLETAIRLRPGYRNAYLNLADVLRAKGQEDEARVVREKAQSIR